MRPCAGAPGVASPGAVPTLHAGFNEANGPSHGFEGAALAPGVCVLAGACPTEGATSNSGSNSNTARCVPNPTPRRNRCSLVDAGEEILEAVGRDVRQSATLFKGDEDMRADVPFRAINRVNCEESFSKIAAWAPRSFATMR